MLHRITLLTISLLFVSSALGADYGGTYADYRYQIRLALGLASTNTTALSDSQLNQCVREAVISVNPVIRGKKQTYTFTTIYGQAVYTLDTSLLSVMAVEWSKNDSLKMLLYVSRETMSQKPTDATQDKRGYHRRPSYYDWLDGQLILYPPPTNHGDTFRVVGTKRIPSIAAIDSLSIIPQQYRVPVMQYATWLAARARQHPLADNFKRDAFDAIKMVNEALNKRKNPSDSGK